MSGTAPGHRGAGAAGPKGCGNRAPGAARGAGPGTPCAGSGVSVVALEQLTPRRPRPGRERQGRCP